MVYLELELEKKLDQLDQIKANKAYQCISHKERNMSVIYKKELEM